MAKTMPPGEEREARAEGDDRSLEKRLWKAGEGRTSCVLEPSGSFSEESESELKRGSACVEGGSGDWDMRVDDWGCWGLAGLL